MGCHTFRISRATNIGGLQKYSSNKIILGSFPIMDLRQVELQKLLKPIYNLTR